MAPTKVNQASAVQEKMAKTEMCKFHSVGKCKRGAFCSFAHGTDELVPKPNLFKTMLCRKWAKGSCNFANCTFAHGEHELRGVERGSKRFDGKERMNDSDVASDTTKSDEGQSRYSDGLEECCGQLMLLHVQAAAMAARDQREESETPLDLWSREFDLKADMPMKVLPFGHSSCGRPEVSGSWLSI
eukprot:CAMPEP_0181474994 /NCGR_PEP_ID=MMETSP1110-20121109/40950_1 /TAXON_ID=174948 /ORGANISM="Symbiodinium sp., Strain CCMP421" /LENGTH=185 /DNA_ID=CAMNT_0023600207 /DNA_START=28 /DNA_END=585 /DNA_ORIENTATION=+